MDWITPQIAIGMFDEVPPVGADVLDLRGVPDHCWINRETFSEAVGFIHATLAGGGKIYVHCIGGVSRSPTIVAAYLAGKLGITGAEAIALVKSKRPQIIPHAEQLASLDSWVNSRVPVAQQ